MKDEKDIALKLIITSCHKKGRLMGLINLFKVVVSMGRKKGRTAQAVDQLEMQNPKKKKV